MTEDGEQGWNASVRDQMVSISSFSLAFLQSECQTICLLIFVYSPSKVAFQGSLTSSVASTPGPTPEDVKTQASGVSVVKEQKNDCRQSALFIGMALQTVLRVSRCKSMLFTSLAFCRSLQVNMNNALSASSMFC